MFSYPKGNVSKLSLELIFVSWRDCIEPKTFLWGKKKKNTKSFFFFVTFEFKSAFCTAVVEVMWSQVHQLGQSAKLSPVQMSSIKQEGCWNTLRQQNYTVDCTFWKFTVNSTWKLFNIPKIY